jgi:hypothetical protein
MRLAGAILVVAGMTAFTPVAGAQTASADSDAEDAEATPSQTSSAPAAQTAEPKKKESVEEVMRETEDDDPFYRNDPKPKTGMGTLIPGWVLVGIGALNLATSPICNTSAVEESQQDLCFKLSLGVGIAGVAIGVPLLIVGYGQRSTFNEWKSRHPNASWLLNTQVALTRDGATLLYSGSF